MARTFLPTLFTLVYVLCGYITRHGDKIRNALPDQSSKDKFDALHEACTAFLLLRDVLVQIGE